MQHLAAASSDSTDAMSATSSGSAFFALRNTATATALGRDDASSATSSGSAFATTESTATATAQSGTAATAAAITQSAAAAAAATAAAECASGVEVTASVTLSYRSVPKRAPSEIDGLAPSCQRIPKAPRYGMRWQHDENDSGCGGYEYYVDVKGNRYGIHQTL